MKPNSAFLLKLFLIITASALHASLIKAQCNAPAMTWANPVLTGGTALQLNAVYKFPSVTPGVDAYVTVTGISGGASLTSVDDNTFGYSAAWQPVVKTPAAMGASTSYVSFKVNFKNSSDNSPHTYTCFQLSCIDVDGDGAGVKEFVAAKDPASTTVSQVTSLTISTLSGGIVQATGTVANYAGIDTAAYNTNVNYKYTSASSIDEVRFGSVTNSTFSVQDRYSCAYFKQITTPPGSTVLAVKYLSFDAFAAGNTVTLNWVTEKEINNNYFEIERSYDGINYAAIGKQPGSAAAGTRQSYQFKDNDPELKSKTVAYYRLKQVDNDGKFSYSGTLVVKLQLTANSVAMQIAPNPFAENLNVSFVAAASGNATIDILNIAGLKIMSKQANVNKGFNSLQVNGVAAISPGIYIARLTIDGVMAGTQKIVKN